MTKTEREVWVAAFAHGSGPFWTRVLAAHEAVHSLRKAARYRGWESGEEGASAMLREVLAADGGES